RTGTSNRWPDRANRRPRVVAGESPPGTPGAARSRPAGSATPAPAEFRYRDRPAAPPWCRPPRRRPPASYRTGSARAAPWCGPACAVPSAIAKAADLLRSAAPVLGCSADQRLQRGEILAAVAGHRIHIRALGDLVPADQAEVVRIGLRVTREQRADGPPTVPRHARRTAGQLLVEARRE